MRFELTDMGIVSALGIGVAETERRMFAGDVSGMKPAEIFVFIVVISGAVELCLHFLGEDCLNALRLNRPFVGELLAGALGMIPNCAVSVAGAKLYLSGAMSPGALMASSFSAGAQAGFSRPVVGSYNRWVRLCRQPFFTCRQLEMQNAGLSARCGLGYNMRALVSGDSC